MVAGSSVGPVGTGTEGLHATRPRMVEEKVRSERRGRMVVFGEVRVVARRILRTGKKKAESRQECV